MNSDASNMPSFTLNTAAGGGGDGSDPKSGGGDDSSRQENVLFDRVLCDVPCRLE